VMEKWLWPYRVALVLVGQLETNAGYNDWPAGFRQPSF
jgi:hypothetical protein